MTAEEKAQFEAFQKEQARKTKIESKRDMRKQLQQMVDEEMATSVEELQECSAMMQSTKCKIFDRFDIRAAGIHVAAGSLSGGNMQKVVVAREFSFDSKVLLIAQPTRGVDIGAMDAIHQQIIEKRNQGCAILLVSADLDELLRLSDRLITIYEGEITGEFRPDRITKEEISFYMTNRKEGSA